MVARARVLREQEVAGNDHVLGHPRPTSQAEPSADCTLVHVGSGREIVVFGVLNDRQIEGLCVLKRAAHDGARHHADAVVAHRDGARFPKLCHLGQIFALLPHGDGTDGMKAWTTHLGGSPQHHLGDRAGVVDRLGVGHHTDVRKAARGRRSQSAPDVLFVFLTGLAQVCVQIDEGGQDPFAGAVDDSGALAARSRASGIDT